MKLVECPRDAMQGIEPWIPTETKIRYLNQLLKVGFDTLDFGSFVSPKAIPQLRDTAEVLAGLELDQTQTKLLAIIANDRGAEAACQYDEIRYLGYPFSISEEFQKRNTNASIEQSLGRVEQIVERSQKHNKEVVLYLSMGFGNPYGEPYSPEIAAQWCRRLYDLFEIKIMALSDTIGVSNPENIQQLFSTLIPELVQVEFGAHLHSTVETRMEKLQAAYDSGCRRMDSALKGWGGCPMAEDELVGNMATETVLAFLQERNLEVGIDSQAFQEAMILSASVFP